MVAPEQGGATGANGQYYEFGKQKQTNYLKPPRLEPGATDAKRSDDLKSASREPTGAKKKYVA